jgi:hypothetical protein
MLRSSTTRSRFRLSLLAPSLGPITIAASFGLVHCGGGGSDPAGADATVDVSTADTGSRGDSTVLTDSGVAADSGAADAGATDVVVAPAPAPCDGACSATQFCTGTGCDDAVFPNLCDNKAVTVVSDPYATDTEAGASLGLAIAASCSDAGVAVLIVPQTQAGVLVQGGDAGWRPNTGAGTTLVAGGGSFGQLSVEYMDKSALTPVFLTNNGTTSHFYQRATGLPLVTVNDDTLGPQHDFFILELAVEPRSGTLCLFGEGIYGAGTAAAGYFGSHVLLPNRASYAAPWYVYEWTDTNNDMTPDSGDSFNLVAQGP